jgi:hypothetical protein
MGTWLLLELVKDHDIIHMMLALQTYRCKSFQLWRLPLRFQRKAWDDRQSVAQEKGHGGYKHSWPLWQGCPRLLEITS